jgi:hypothetical protein
LKDLGYLSVSQLIEIIQTPQLEAEMSKNTPMSFKPGRASRIINETEE